MSFNFCISICVFYVYFHCIFCVFFVLSTFVVNRYANKFAQSNLGRGPRRGTVAHVRRKVPIGYNSAPQICPQKYPLPVDRSLNPTTCLIPGLVRPMVPNGIRIRSDPPFFHNALGRPMHVRTNAQTDRSSTGKCDHYRPLRSESDAA